MSTVKYYRNLSWQPIKLKLFTLTPDIHYKRSCAYLIVYQSDAGNIVISVQSLQEELRFELNSVQKLELKTEGENIVVRFGYGGEWFGMETGVGELPQLQRLLKSVGGMQNKGKIGNQKGTPVKTKKAEVGTQQKRSPFVKKPQQPIPNLPPPPSFKLITPSTKPPNKYIQKQLPLTNPKYQLNPPNISLCVLGGSGSGSSSSSGSGIFTLFSGDLLKLYGVAFVPSTSTLQSLKLIHASNHINTNDIVKAVPMMNSTLVVQLRRAQKYGLTVVNVETGEEVKVDLKERYGVGKEIKDFILSKEIYKQDMLILTEGGTYLMNISDNHIPNWTLKPLDPSGLYCKLFNHSLSGYAALDSGSNLYLFKSLTNSKPFYQDTLPRHTTTLTYSSKFILYFFNLKLQLLLLESFAKNTQRLNIINLDLKRQHIKEFNLQGQTFIKAEFSTNRTYVVAAIANLLVIWRLDDVLQDELVYEVRWYAERVQGIGCVAVRDREGVWVVLERGQVLEVLEV